MTDYEGTIQLHYEYMDTRELADAKHYENLYNLYKFKARFRKYHVIIAADNNALEFLLEYGRDLYPGVPVVFCGIKNLKRPLTESDAPITGVLEGDTLEPTVEVALKLHPSTKQVYLVMNDVSPASGRLRQIASLNEKYGRRIEFKKHVGAEPAEVLEITRGLPADSLLLLDMAFVDPRGGQWSYEQVAETMSKECFTPTYATNPDWIAYPPVIGGKINSGFHQGQAAAQLALRIFNGEDPRQIPIVRGTVDRFVFDYNQLKGFNIPHSALPRDGIIVNEPESFYASYKGWIWVITLTIGVLTAVVFSLAITIMYRKRAQVQLLGYQKQLKLLASQLSLAEERERHRIATELHDRVCQSLVMSKFKLQQISESEVDGSLMENLVKICEYLDHVIQSTRLLTFDLSYPILYELGFEAAVAEWLTEQIEQHGISTEFVDDGRHKPLESDICILLFRSVRELLTNVIKHSHARNVKVVSQKIDGRIRVEIADDGVGFDPSGFSASAKKAVVSGLFSIRERLEQLGGSVEVDSETGRGTKIKIEAPLKQETAEKEYEDEFENRSGG